MLTGDLWRKEDTQKIWRKYDMAKVVSVEMIDNKDAVMDLAKEKINAWLEAIGEDAASTAANVLTETGTIVTGRLKNSISSAVVEEEQAVYIGTNVEYAIWHEFGTGIYAEEGGRQTPWMFQDKDGVWHWTRGVKPKHYLQFGITAHQQDYKDLLERKMRE